MSDTTPDREPFGVGTILSETFALVFRHLGQMLLIGAIPAILGAAMNVLVYGAASQSIVQAVLDPESVAAADADLGTVTVVLVLLAGMVLWAFAGAALTQAAWDAHGEGAVDVRRSLGVGIERIVPVALWLTLGVIAIYVACFALIVPGLWLAGVWIALLPVLVIERLGAGAFRRSAELSRGYRWPAVGLLVLFMLTMLGIGLVAILLQGVAYLAGDAGVAVGMAITVALSALYYALSGALVALAYARLREIREGSGRPLADVFA